MLTPNTKTIPTPPTSNPDPTDLAIMKHAIRAAEIGLEQGAFTFRLLILECCDCSPLLFRSRGFVLCILLPDRELPSFELLYMAILAAGVGCGDEI